MSSKYRMSMGKGPTILVVERTTRLVVAKFSSDQSSYIAARNDATSKAEAFIVQQSLKEVMCEQEHPSHDGREN